MTKRLHSVLLVAPGFAEVYLTCNCGWSEFLGGSVKPEYALKVADQHYKYPGDNCPRECDSDCELGQWHCWYHHEPAHRRLHDPVRCDERTATLREKSKETS